MKISKSSWHYWLVSKFNSEYDIPHSLCPYVRKVISSIIWAFIAACAIGAMIWFFLATPVMFWMAKAGWIVVGADTLKVGVVSQAVWLFCIGGFLVNLAREKYKDRNQSKPEKAPGLISSYIKAKKDKFCPTIEFVGE